MPIGELSIGYSIHRSETLPFARKAMGRHDAIVLEEPPDAMVGRMLAGELDIADYLLGKDFEDPLFASGLCEVLRGLHASGKTILQIDPFLQCLEEIHDFFGSGGTPGEIASGSVRHAVYLAEHRATAALLAYYRCVPNGSFDDLVQAVKGFARADASRGRLRDRLRAQAILDRASRFRSVYVESGQLHVALHAELRKRRPPACTVRRLDLMRPVVRAHTGRSTVLSPGDLLTILYTFRPVFEGRKADVLAARNLVHTKLLESEAIPIGDVAYPDTLDEIRIKRWTGRLGYEEAARLFGKIRQRPSAEARRIVAAHLDDSPSAP